ncbi:hypothetical protein LINPERPRIM_LOCUS8840 [Linum perenne]
MISSTLSSFGPFSESFANAFLEWKGMNCSPTFHGGSSLVFHALLWYVWLEWNNRIFNDNTFCETQVFLRNHIECR